MEPLGIDWHEFQGFQGFVSVSSHILGRAGSLETRRLTWGALIINYTILVCSL